MKTITATRLHGSLLWNENEHQIPIPKDDQYLVKVLASSVNPVDYKFASKLAEGETSKVLGWDAVAEILSDVSTQGIDNKQQIVWYLGSTLVDGCQSEYQVVDKNLLVPAPKSLAPAEAASLPLTGLTALELLLDKLAYLPEKCAQNAARPLLLINGAGGVGSILLQLCKLWGIPVVATASREESQRWCLTMGATTVISHQALASLQPDQFASIVCAHDTDKYFADMVRLAAPFGHIILLSSSNREHHIQLLMAKSVSIGFEFVFTRIQNTADGRKRQQTLLSLLSSLVDDGAIKSTTTQIITGLTANNIQHAHELLQQQKIIGKIVIKHT